MDKHIDFGTFAVALVTLALFLAALFTKGLSHDLFLEAGVFLVSVKIIVMAYRNSISIGRLGEKLDMISAQLQKKDQDPNGDGGSQGRAQPRE